MSQAVKEAINDSRFPNPKVFAWTDSQMTLAWIKDKPRKWKFFVANRVDKIQSIIPSENWIFVRTEDNPANCASPGISADKLLNHQLWWKGPNWLRQDEQFWPSLDVAPPCNSSTDALAEVNSSAQLFLVMQHQQQDNRILDLISRQSSMYRRVRVFAYVKLFTQRLQARKKRRSSNNHSQSLPAIDHSNTYQKPKPKAVSDKKPHGNVQLKSSDNDQDYQHLQQTMKSRDQYLNNFTEKPFVTNQHENPCKESSSSRNNQDAPHLQSICY